MYANIGRPERKLKQLNAIYYYAKILTNKNAYSKLYVCKTKGIETINISQKRCWYIQHVCDSNNKHFRSDIIT